MTLARQTGDPPQAGGAITLSSHPDAAPQYRLTVT